MGYEKSTIKKIMQEIEHGKVYLPAIQRKYVWADNQITRLFDSIMLGYPIGTFLFWKIKVGTVNDKQYLMYKFIRDYHERDMYENPSAPSPLLDGREETIWSVLDGQQRLTSMYIALQGSMSRKLPNKRWKNDDAFPEKELYFNLHSNIEDDEESSYEFKFLTAEDSQSTKDGALWYKVKNILQYTQKDLVKEVILKHGWQEDDIAMENISLLHTRLTGDELINYFEVEAESIDSVLDIFVRVNSGGTVLSKTDLLFSTIVSYWDKARDEIDKLLSTINKIGEGYRFTNDFIMRACLYLLDMPVTLKVETFKKESVKSIQDNWEKIKSAIYESVSLFNEFGFNSENIISYVALTPVVYYRFNNGKFDDNSKSELRKYIVMAQIKQVFGAASNSALTSIRTVLKANTTRTFSLNDLNGIRFTGDRSLKVSSDEIDQWFDTYEIGAYTFMLLSLLYPNLKYSQKGFHQDHMHPHTSFEGKKLDGMALPGNIKMDEDRKKEWQRKRNTLANLQLLESNENEKKNATPLNKWLDEEVNKENLKYLPQNISFELNNFEEFINERQKMMSSELKKILL